MQRRVIVGVAEFHFAYHAGINIGQGNISFTPQISLKYAARPRRRYLVAVHNAVSQVYHYQAAAISEIGKTSGPYAVLRMTVCYRVGDMVNAHQEVTALS